MHRYGDMENQFIIMRHAHRFVFAELENVCSRLAEQKRKFQDRIDVLFEPYIKSGRQQNNFEWKCVKSIYNDIKNDVGCIWSLKMCCVFVVKLFCTFKCEDQTLIMKVIYMYHQVLNEYKSNVLSVLDLCLNCIQLNNPRHYFFEEVVGTSSILSKINDRIGYTYRFTNGELYSKLTRNAIDGGDYDFLKFLVAYGLSYRPERNLEDVTHQLKELYNTYDRWKFQKGYNVQIRQRNFIDPVVQQYRLEETDLKQPSIRKLIIIVRHVIMCLRRSLNDNFFSDCLRCLKLYVLTLPEVAISVKDVEDFFKVAFPNDEAFISEISSDYKEVFDNPNLCSPRSLQHLCRCKVRKCIQKQSPLPTMLSDLKIPKKIKDFLLFSSD